MNEKSRVIIISGKHPLTSPGGYASYSRSLAKVIKNIGYEVDIFCLGKENKIQNTKIGTIHQVSVPFLEFFKYQEMAGFPFFAPLVALSIAKFSRNRKIIIWGIGPWTFCASILKIFKTRTVIFADYFTSIKHEFSGAGKGLKEYSFFSKNLFFIASLTLIPFYSFLEYFVLKISTQVITHYKTTEKILSKQFPFVSKKFVRLPYTVETQNTQQAQNISKRIKLKQILCISRHDRRKGIPVLLKAFSLLSERKISFSAVIIGNGPFLETHRHILNKLGLRNVKIIGFVKNIYPYLKSSSIFVLPSLEEGSSSLSILEAARYGLPIVATNIDGIPNDVTNRKSAILVKPGNPEELADALEKLVKNPGLCLKMGRLAQKEFQKKHGTKNTEKQIKKFLKKYGF